MRKRYASEEIEDSDNDDIDKSENKKANKVHQIKQKKCSENIILKITNREKSGFFNASNNLKSHSSPYKEIPSSLSFCLKDIVPICYLESHIFMGKFN